MAEASTIFEAARECRQGFRKATTVPRLMHQEWAENRLADFNLWAIGAGASSTGKASLDHRLHANPEAHTILFNLLLMLRILLQKCREIEDTLAELSKEESARFQDVENSLSQLTRLTVAIRKAGTRSRLQKADNKFDPDGPQIRSLRRHLEFLILVRPDEHGISYFSQEQLNSTALSPIQSQLIDANLKRRNRFIYAQTHAQKLDNNSGHRKDTPRGNFGLGKHSRHFDLAQTDSLVDMDNTIVRNDPQTQSTTTATVVDEQIEIPSAQIPKPATTVVSVTSSRITYPKCPPLHDHQMLFTCPCCCQSLPASVGRGNSWKKHLMGDILPYTCIFEDCLQADTFYMTKETWLSHMGEEHGDTVQWVCHSCSQKNLYATFRDPADFTAHIQQQHSKGIRPNQIPMLLSSWRRKVPFEISACPLCNFQSDDQTALLDHTAEHIHSFSLRSLPWAPREGLEIEDDDQEKEDGEGYGTFFEQNPYFDVDSCWSEPSGSPPRESHIATDLDSIVDSDSGESDHSVLEQQQHQQQQLTEDQLNQIPHDPSGQTGTSDWLNSLTFFSSSPEDRLGSIIGNWLSLTSILAVGSHDVVYSAVDINTQTHYAVKALSKDPRYLEMLKTEIRLHHKASGHPNVVSLIRIVDTIDVTYVVLEFFPEGDLFSNIVDKGNYVGNDTLVKRVFMQILDAVQYCHSVGIYHRNLAPENFLVADGGMTVKLTAFRLASEDYATSDFGCGTIFYMSPECQQEDQPPDASYLSAPNDVWSLGVILVNLTCGRNPWKRASLEDSTYRAYRRDPSFLQSILPLSTEVTAILNRIFELDPSKRITLPELRSLILECPRFTTDFPPSWLPSRGPDPPGQGADNLGGTNQYGSAPETPEGSVVEGQHHDNVESSINVPDYEDEEWMYQSSGGQ
ncbi:hypothetical protein PEBR_18808 [Penicillium brasilianum]|uniref:Protein kinase domain-containing protein n=1 Tax=Penicillium brasilianum TaxID=104259 RepID=A0A1S9RNL0_PENBI|nr:hypothetical protein PEBR_18808 [Penicillium brasilianum]